MEKAKKLETPSDSPEWIKKCLHCKRTTCAGTCPDDRSAVYEARVKGAARAIFSGQTIREAAETVGVTEGRITRYMKTRLYADEMKRLRNEGI